MFVDTKLFVSMRTCHSCLANNVMGCRRVQWCVHFYFRQRSNKGKEYESNGSSNSALFPSYTCDLLQSNTPSEKEVIWTIIVPREDKICSKWNLAELTDIQISTLSTSFVPIEKQKEGIKGIMTWIEAEIERRIEEVVRNSTRSAWMRKRQTKRYVICRRAWASVYLCVYACVRSHNQFYLHKDCYAYTWTASVNKWMHSHRSQTKFDNRENFSYQSIVEHQRMTEIYLFISFFSSLFLEPSVTFTFR